MEKCFTSKAFSLLLVDLVLPDFEQVKDHVLFIFLFFKRLT